MVVVSRLFSDKFREGMTRCESYPPCSGTIYFPTAPFRCVNIWFLYYLLPATTITYSAG